MATILSCITRWKKTSWGESFNSVLNNLVAFVINNFVNIDQKERLNQITRVCRRKMFPMLSQLCATDKGKGFFGVV